VEEVAEKAEAVQPVRPEVQEQKEGAHRHPTQADALPPVQDLHAAQTDTMEAVQQSPIVQVVFRHSV
jgi:hypothetical protein